MKYKNYTTLGFCFGKMLETPLMEGVVSLNNTKTESRIISVELTVYGGIYGDKQ